MFVLWPANLHKAYRRSLLWYQVRSRIIMYYVLYIVRCRFPTDFPKEACFPRFSLNSVSVQFSKLHEQEPCYHISNTNIQSQIQNNACHLTNNKSRLTSYMHQSWNMIYLLNSITDICQIVNLADHRSCVYGVLIYYYVMCDMIHHRTQGRKRTVNNSVL